MYEGVMTEDQRERLREARELIEDVNKEFVSNYLSDTPVEARNDGEQAALIQVALYALANCLSC